MESEWHSRIPFRMGKFKIHSENFENSDKNAKYCILSHDVSYYVYN